MKKFLLTSAVALMSISSTFAENVSGMKITLNNDEVVQIALSTIKNITYQDATTMLVNYNDGTEAKSFAIDNVKNMVLANVDASGIEVIDTDNASSGVYQVFDESGKLLEKGDYTGSLPSLSNQKSGVYIVKIGSRSVKISKN